MLKIATVGVAALLLTTSPLAYGQSSPAAPQGRMSATDADNLDVRIDTLQAALQLTPDQEKYWPPIETALRTRAQHRAARLMDFAGRMDQLNSGDASPNPVEFMHRRADALAQRATDLKQLADAWDPLYQKLDPQQKRRLAFLAVSVLRRVRNGGGVGTFGGPSDDDDQP
jgi:LTXXQ motif family protein